MVDLGACVLLLLAVSGIAFAVGARRLAIRLLLAGVVLAVLVPFALAAWRSL